MKDYPEVEEGFRKALINLKQERQAEADGLIKLSNRIVDTYPDLYDEDTVIIQRGNLLTATDNMSEVFQSMLVDSEPLCKELLKKLIWQIEFVSLTLSRCD